MHSPNKWFKFRTDVNYWISENVALACFLLTAPYLVGIAGAIFYKPIIPFMLLGTPFLIFFLLIRQIPVITRYSLSYDDSKKSIMKKDFFSGKWMKRSKNQFIYIMPVDNEKITIFVHHLTKSWYDWSMNEEDWNPDSSVETRWGEWDLSETRIATKKEIEKHSLECRETIILLGESR